MALISIVQGSMAGLRACRFRAYAIGITMLMAVTSASGFAIKLGNHNHQSITLKGLNPASGLPAPEQSVIYPSSPKLEIQFDDGSKAVFWWESVQEITEHNIRVDDLQGLQHSDKHFDSDDLARGSRRLIQLREVIIDDLVDASFADLSGSEAAIESAVRVRHARAMMGQALHTLQDFYAHSNWVELSNFSSTAINHELGQKVLPSPGLDKSCNESNPTAGGVLTSGWFEGDLLQICQAPQGKCAHGDGQVCGINKDSLAQAGASYVAARAQATIATQKYVKDTLLLVLANRTRLIPGLNEPGARLATQMAVCQFMGVPDPAETCMKKYNLQVLKQQDGTGTPVSHGLVTSAPAGIDCGDTCAADFAGGTQVTLTTADAPPWIFVRWGDGGACAGSTSRTCVVDMTSDRTAKAMFAPLTPTPVSLQSYQYYCVLFIYQDAYECLHTPNPGPGIAVFHEELGQDYGGTPQDGGGFAYIKVDGQVNVQDGTASIESSVDASAVGQWFSRGKQEISANYSKSIVVTSNSLPPGTPVTVRVTFHVNLQYALTAELSEPPTVQWSAQWPQLSATVWAVNGLNGGQVGLASPPNPSVPTIASRSESFDLIVQGAVGESIPVAVSITANSNQVETARAHVQAEMSARVSGPYLVEVNGLDVQFIGD